MEYIDCPQNGGTSPYLEVQEMTYDGCPTHGWASSNPTEMLGLTDAEAPPPYSECGEREGFTNLCNVGCDNPQGPYVSISYDSSNVGSAYAIYSTADGASRGRTRQSNGCSEQQPQNAEKECRSKPPILLMIIILSCICSVIICCLILTGTLENYRPVSDDGNTKIIRVPCDDLSMYVPEAAWYKSTQNFTKQKMEAAGIRVVIGQGNDDVSCEVSLDMLMGRIIRNEYNAVEGQVTLETKETGPTFSYSKYTLSIKYTGQLNGIKSHPYGLLIEEEGPYFLYFGMQLDYNSGCCRHLRYKTSITHLLVNQTARPPRALLGSEYTCTEAHDTEKTTTFTGGLFHLKPKDKLFIQVSSTEIVGDSGDNFLGVFKLQ